jgi:hypothetical protein
MPKSLADGHVKLAILTTEPVNPEAPTPTELTAGINAACNILKSDFLWSATDSDKVAEAALCETNNANALGASNFQGGMTVFRYFNGTTGAPDPTEDALFAAVQDKGTELWVYARKNGKLESAAWADTDEIYLGGRVLTDEPQAPTETGGYIKFRVPLEVQAGWPFIAADATP